MVSLLKLRHITLENITIAVSKITKCRQSFWISAGITTVFDYLRLDADICVTWSKNQTRSTHSITDCESGKVCVAIWDCARNRISIGRLHFWNFHGNGLWSRPLMWYFRLGVSYHVVSRDINLPISALISSRPGKFMGQFGSALLIWTVEIILIRE